MNKRHKLYIEPLIRRALKIKIEEGCPHIHFSIEENCDGFTSSLIWLEVLSRGIKAAKAQGACVISYTPSSPLQVNLSFDEQEIINKMQRKIEKSLASLEIIDNRI